MKLANKINRATDYLKVRLGDLRPTVGLILGSGLGVIADAIEEPLVIPYGEIPDFPQTHVKGHAGQLVVGTLKGKTVIVLKGRFHYYEGHRLDTIGIPIRVFKKLGVEDLVITTATGGVNENNVKMGDLMLITDHINWVGTNPLVGPNLAEFGPRFPDTSKAYTPQLQDLARGIAKELKINLKEGTYLFTTGPSYETPAEVRMMQVLGADVAGMSTVPETLTAAHAGMAVVAITFVANMGAGLTDEKLTHDDVMATMDLVKDDFIGLVEGLVEKI